MLQCKDGASHIDWPSGASTSVYYFSAGVRSNSFRPAAASGCMHCNIDQVVHVASSCMGQTQSMWRMLRGCPIKHASFAQQKNKHASWEENIPLRHV